MSVKLERSLIVTADGGSEIDADAAFAQFVAAVDAIYKKVERSKGEIEFALCSWHGRGKLCQCDP